MRSHFLPFFVFLFTAGLFGNNSDGLQAQPAGTLKKTTGNISGKKAPVSELERWQAQARRVKIIRDGWGIPHVYGQSDADAVFGLLYAQCEDDFKRVELNYIEKLGRMSELRGEGDFYNDLLIRLLIDTTEAKRDYATAAPWMKQLLVAYADGINFFLYKNPGVKPALLTRFEPWYPLLWTDGSIGAINTADITAAELKKFYPGVDASVSLMERPADHQTGSNGFAIGPSKSVSGNAMLYINPHVTFYFRPEVHMVSNEGLNAYGAVTWGQFFVYQGFNPYCGWMHTSSNVDVADMYEEEISFIKEKNGKEAPYYRYNNEWKRITERELKISFKTANGKTARSVKAYYTHHGPVMASRDGKWIALRSFNRSAVSLRQSWLRTKARGLEDYKKVMDLRANTSNNTVFADNKGNIAYWHGNYVPVRDPSYNWSKPVDGTVKATEWKGLHTVEQVIHSYNPASGWIQNCNSTPFTLAGSSSPKRDDYPAYMAPDGENFRGINAVRVLSASGKFTMGGLVKAGYDRHLAAFDVLIPALVKVYDGLPATDSLRMALQGPVDSLRYWSRSADAGSVATLLAVEWAQKLGPAIQRVYINAGEADQVQKTQAFAATADALKLLQPLKETVEELKKRWGRWQVPWGMVNRFQRITGALQESYNDSLPSLPVPYASALWGQLPSYNSRYYPGTIKRYGVSGNSFVCVVEFGKKVVARSLLAGGNSGDPASPHFMDQAERYTKGEFKDVLFYKEDVLKGARRQYHPGASGSDQ